MKTALANLWHRSRQFCRSEAGQNITEYGLFVGLVVCGALAAVPDVLVPVYHIVQKLQSVMTAASSPVWYLHY
jgi:Flp pilus assembly pilin Flp